MKRDLDQLRLRSALRNHDLDINRVDQDRERFVHILQVDGHPSVELHMPFDWVGLGENDEIVFTQEGEKFVRESRDLLIKP
jgi:hypothetical protein